MATLVLTEGITDVEVVSESGQVEVALWHYYVPCVGVRYYSYDRVLATEEETDIWELGQLAA